MTDSRNSRVRNPQSSIAPVTIERVPGGFRTRMNDRPLRFVDTPAGLFEVTRAMDRQLADLDGETEYAVVEGDTILFSHVYFAQAIAFLTAQPAGTQLIAMRT